MYKLIQIVKKIFICVKNSIYGLYMCLRKIGLRFFAFVVSLDEIFFPEKYFVYTKKLHLEWTLCIRLLFTGFSVCKLASSIRKDSLCLMISLEMPYTISRAAFDLPSNQIFMQYVGNFERQSGDYLSAVQEANKQITNKYTSKQICMCMHKQQ